MPACPYCKSEINEKYNFCLHCDRQVKCTQCEELLVAGKTRCFVCGSPLISQELPETQMNEFTLEEKQTTKSAYRRINGRLTNNAFGQAASLFGGTSSPRLTTQAARTTPPPSQKLLPAFLGNQEEVDDQAGEGSHPVDQFARPSQSDSDKDKALRLFEVDADDELVARATDYKGKSKKEQQQRFILLYIWAYQHVFGRAVPSKEHMNNAAKRASLHDSNFANHFGQTTKEFLMLGDAGYKVKTPGIAKVDEIISGMEDSDLEGFAYWKVTASKPSRKRASLSKEDEQKVNQWLEKPTGIDEFDIRKLKSASDLAAFSIWVITKKLRVESAVRPKEAYSYLKGKYKTISVKPDRFSEVLRKNSNKFGRTQEGLYFLKENVERKVEALVQETLLQEAKQEISSDEEGNEE